MKDITSKINEAKGITLSIQLSSNDEVYTLFNAVLGEYRRLEGEQKYYKKDYENAYKALIKATKDAGIELDPDYDCPIQKVKI